MEALWPLFFKLQVNWWPIQIKMKDMGSYFLMREKQAHVEEDHCVVILEIYAEGEL